MIKKKRKKNKYPFKYWAFVYSGNRYVEHITFSNRPFKTFHYDALLTDEEDIEDLENRCDYLISNGGIEYVLYFKKYTKQGYTSKAIRQGDIQTIIKIAKLDKMDRVPLYEACLKGHEIALAIRQHLKPVKSNGK